VKRKVTVKDHKKRFKTQINGKLNDISSADENKYQNITVQPLFKYYKKTVHLFIDRRL
jgi:hypothetical protein